MKKALVHGSRICEIREKEFPVAPELKWVDVADDTTTFDVFENGQVIKHNEQPGPPIDQSDLDNMGKSIKVLALLMLRYCNELRAGTYTDKTLAELKADARAIWTSLP